MPVASSAPERHRTLRLVQYSANGMARFSVRIVRKVCRWFGVSPPEAAETSLACRAKFPTVRGPVRSCLRPCVEDHRGGASSGPGSRRRDGVYPCDGRTRRRRASPGRTRTTSIATGQPWDVARLRPTSGEERGRISGRAESSGLAVQRAASFAFDGCREPRRHDAVMARMSRRWIPVGGCATRDGGELRARLRKRHLT